MTDFMQTLITLFILFFYSLCALVLFDIFVRPRLCPSSATTTSAENDNDNDNDAISLSHSTASTTTISASVSSANNGDSPFNMQQVTVSSFGSS
mmetsp:Transcript_14632/g.29832  ORF Transcript_14632/g.29832 Transcript_14632/m.29832 type:complete len:94 (+) Transcript_14632:128-409(+)